MSHDIIYGPIEATNENAADVQSIVLDDLMNTLGLEERTARSIANPESDQMIDRQKTRLLGRASYVGAWLHQGSEQPQLSGVLKHGAWTHGDAQEYAGGLTAQYERVMTYLHNEHVLTTKRGIHHLSARHELDSEIKTEILIHLADYALRAEPRHPFDKIQTFVPLLDHDPARPVLESRGFIPTGKYGSPVGTVSQQLYLRTQSVTKS